MASTKIKRSCRRKKKYDTEELAQLRANSLWKSGVYLKPYKCGSCGGWHLTKVSSRKVLEQAFKQIERERRK